jgi:hypothetical protein
VAALKQRADGCPGSKEPIQNYLEGERGLLFLHLLNNFFVLKSPRLLNEAQTG